MRLFQPALLIASLLTLSSCASLHSVSMTRVPVQRSNPIRAEANTWGLLAIYFSNSFVDEGISDLRSQCQGGKISGVFTKYSGRFYLLWTTRKVELEAFCERGKGV